MRTRRKRSKTSTGAEKGCSDRRGRPAAKDHKERCCMVVEMLRPDSDSAAGDFRCLCSDRATPAGHSPCEAAAALHPLSMVIHARLRCGVDDCYTRVTPSPNSSSRREDVPTSRALVHGALGAQERLRLRRSFRLRGLIVHGREQSEDEAGVKESKASERLDFRSAASSVSASAQS